MNSRVYSIAGVVLIAFVALHALFTLFSEGNAGVTQIALAASEAPDDLMGRSNSAPARTVTQTHTVCKEGPPFCNFTIVQEAVDTAGTGDLVKVASGIYTDVHARNPGLGYRNLPPSGVVTQVVFITKSIFLQGGYTITNNFADPPDPLANLTTLAAQGAGRVILINGSGSINEGFHPAVKGFQIRDGDATDLGGCSDYGNGCGGGIDIIRARTTIADNLFVANHAGADGGAVHLSVSESTLFQNTFIGNSAGGVEEGSGGGIYGYFGSAVIEGNSFWSNAANLGGAIGLRYGSASVIDNEIISNTARVPMHREPGAVAPRAACMKDTGFEQIPNATGGGLWIQNAFTIDIDNNVVADNVGGGIYFDHSRASLRHNTVARHEVGLMLRADSVVTLTDTVVVGHDIGVAVVSATSEVSLQATVWGSGSWSNHVDWSGEGNIVTGTVNIWGDPAFVDPDAGDYHLDSSSAARDAGLPAGVNRDIDGHLRPMGYGVDIGADEYPTAGLYLNRPAPGPYQNRGATMTHELNVSSTPFGTASGIVLTATLDGWQRPKTVSSPDGHCDILDDAWGGMAVCQLGDLESNALALVTMTVEVSSSVPMGAIITSSLRATANETANHVEFESLVHNCHVRLGNAPAEFITVQAAVDTAQAGDEVKVAGTCLGVSERNGYSQQVLIDNDLTVRGGYTTSNWLISDPVAQPTLLDALHLGPAIIVQGPATVTLEALQIAHGGLTSGWNDRSGGVVAFQAMFTISDSVIYESYRGVTLLNSQAMIANNQVISNFNLIDSAGLGIYGGHAMLSQNTIRHNVCDSMGIFDCPGGGIGVHNSEVVLDGNDISENKATDGGGVFARSSTITMNRNVVVANDFSGVSLNSSHGMLTNNVLADSPWVGLVLDKSYAEAIHNTVVGDHASSSYSGILLRQESTANLTNTIVVSSAVGIRVRDDSSATLEATLWGSGAWANGQDWEGAAIYTGTINIWADPGFVNPSAGDYHLAFTSAAIDQGIATEVSTDVDNDARPYGLAPDLGADEYVGFRSNLWLPVLAKPK